LARNRVDPIVWARMSAPSAASKKSPYSGGSYEVAHQRTIAYSNRWADAWPQITQHSRQHSWQARVHRQTHKQPSPSPVSQPSAPSHWCVPLPPPNSSRNRRWRRNALRRPIRLHLRLLSRRIAHPLTTHGGASALAASDPNRLPPPALQNSDAHPYFLARVARAICTRLPGCSGPGLSVSARVWWFLFSALPFLGLNDHCLYASSRSVLRGAGRYFRRRSRRIPPPPLLAPENKVGVSEQVASGTRRCMSRDEQNG
jgi:hypothetical protein